MSAETVRRAKKAWQEGVADGLPPSAIARLKQIWESELLTYSRSRPAGECMTVSEIVREAGEDPDE